MIRGSGPALQKRRADLVAPDAPLRAWGEGQQRALDCLARYAFRVDITNARIVGLDDEAVTIRREHRASNRWRTGRIRGREFMRRSLQRAPPEGLRKVRYFGSWRRAKRKGAAQFVRKLSPSGTRDHDPQTPSPCNRYWVVIAGFGNAANAFGQTPPISPIGARNGGVGCARPSPTTPSSGLDFLVAVASKALVPTELS